MSSVFEATAFTAEHLDGALLLSQQAGWAHGREDWELLHRLSTGYVLLCDKQVVGTGFRTDFGSALSALNMIIIREDMRGQGLGRRLMTSLMPSADDKTYRLIATRMGRPLHESIGFTQVGQLVTMRGLLTDVQNHSGAKDLEEGDRESLISLESDAYGGDRTALVDWLLAHSKLAVIGKQGAITGYAALRQFGAGYVIGPVVSANLEDAKALISHLARNIEGEVLRLDATTDSALGPWLETLGLSLVDAPPVMQRGQVPLNENRQALFSQALG